MTAPTTPPDAAINAIQQRLLARARRSVEAHRDFRTVRREQQQWLAFAPGCRRALLVETPAARVAMFSLDRGATLPWPDGTAAQEVLLVAGRADACPAGGEAARIAPWSLALRTSPEAGSLTAADGPATFYVRQLTTEPRALPDPEGAWWRLPRSDFEIVQAARRRWIANAPGVDVLPLWGSREITSMLVRFAPGAGVPDHHHAVNEDCLMLEGEMFLGDILLRPGDYQLAPAGGGHFGEMSDIGGTFYFHGAVDPVLLAPRPAT